VRLLLLQPLLAGRLAIEEAERRKMRSLDSLSVFMRHENSKEKYFVMLIMTLG
jgi:hypothetical protein